MKNIPFSWDFKNKRWCKISSINSRTSIAFQNVPIHIYFRDISELGNFEGSRTVGYDCNFVLGGFMKFPIVMSFGFIPNFSISNEGFEIWRKRNTVSNKKPRKRGRFHLGKQLSEWKDNINRKTIPKAKNRPIASSQFLQAVGTTSVKTHLTIAFRWVFAHHYAPTEVIFSSEPLRPSSEELGSVRKCWCHVWKGVSDSLGITNFYVLNPYRRVSYKSGIVNNKVTIIVTITNYSNHDHHNHHQSSTSRTCLNNMPSVIWSYVQWIGSLTCDLIKVFQCIDMTLFQVKRQLKQKTSKHLQPIRPTTPWSYLSLTCKKSTKAI